jgi:hypothetical protein
VDSIHTRSQCYTFCGWGQKREKNGPEGRRGRAGTTARLLLAQAQVDRQTVLGARHRRRRGYAIIAHTHATYL